VKSPNYAGGYDGLAYCYGMKGQHEKAAENYRKATELQPQNGKHSIIWASTLRN